MIYSVKNKQLLKGITVKIMIHSKILIEWYNMPTSILDTEAANKIYQIRTEEIVQPARHFVLQRSNQGLIPNIPYDLLSTTK